ncbi:MAG: cobalamin biosynthesis protein CobQ [Ruminococcus sp.]|nr:cobalamin biosynthesis protein CobQ [Ruminococcus sp.]
MKRITVICGHYGSGKSTFAANYAVKCAEEGFEAAVADMDTVNPYYRTADLETVFREKGVRLISPMYAGSNLDVPVLDYDIPALYGSGANLVIDLGGDEAGAYPLGKYREFLRERTDETEILYVVNCRRFLTRTPREAEAAMREIENACGLRATGIVNNTNLGFETDERIIAEGTAYAERISELTGLPVFCHTFPKIRKCREISGDKFFPVEIYIKNVWDTEM